MFRLEKKFTFEAAHKLPTYCGRGHCERLHGHSFVGYLVCEGPIVHRNGPLDGILVDYADIGTAIKPLLENHLDHWYLNESTGLFSPTSENLAVWIYDRVKKQLPLLTEVIIEETCTSRCTFRPGTSL